MTPWQGRGRADGSVSQRRRHAVVDRPTYPMSTIVIDVRIECGSE